MIQAKIFDSIINNNKELADEIFIKERGQINKILENSRLKILFLELVALDKNEEEDFLKLRREILLRNQVIISDILYLAKNLNAFNIRYVFIKGAATLFQIEQSRRVRFTSDIDILIDIKDINKIHLMLKKIGIKHSFDTSHDYMNSKKNHSLETIQLNSGIYLDIHFRSSSPLDFSVCPYSKTFLQNFDVIDENNIEVKVLKLDQIHIFSLYQLFIRDEVNNCSSSIIDLILIKNFYKSCSEEKASFTDRDLKIDNSISSWKLIRDFNANNYNKFEKEFSLNVFSNPKIKILKRIRVIFLNILFLKRSIKEEYGETSKMDNLYFKFFLDKIKKLCGF